MNNVKHSDAFKRLLEMHPRIDTERYARVLLAIDNLKDKHKKVTNTKVGAHLGEDRNAVAQRIRKFEKCGYVELKGRSKSGRTIMFWVVEGSTGSYWGQEEKEKLIKEHCMQLFIASKIAQVAKVVGAALLEEIRKALEAGDFFKARAKHQQALECLKKAHLKGKLKFVWIQSSALKIVLTASGEVVVEKIKEESKEESEKKSATGKSKDKASAEA